MTAGYFLENIAAFLFTCAVLLCRKYEARISSRLRHILSKTYDTFYFCAVFLTFSIQIAVMITLSEANFGITTNGMGGYTVQLTWTVSVLTLFPLTYVALMPGLIGVPKDSEDHIQQADSNREGKEEKDRELQRTLLYLICLLLSFYPFVSSMFSMYGKSQIGNSPGSVINSTDWQSIQNICFENVSYITNEETGAMKACLTLSWIIIFGFTIGKLVLDISRGTAPKPTLQHHGPLKRLIPLSKSLNELPWEQWPLVLVPILAITQFWTYLRLHQAQKQIAEATGNLYQDNQWSFGQIVAITVFAPVITECWFWTRRTVDPHRHRRGKI
jgi:hypothetical protein